VVDAVKLEGLQKEIIITSPFVRNRITEHIECADFMQVFAIAQKSLLTNWTSQRQADWAKKQFDQGQMIGKPIAYSQKENKVEPGLIIYSFNDQNEKVRLAEFMPIPFETSPISWWDQFMNLFDDSKPRPFGFSLVTRGFTGFDDQNEGNPESVIQEQLDISLLLGIVSKYGRAGRITPEGHFMDNLAKAFDQGYSVWDAVDKYNPQQPDTVAFMCTYRHCKDVIYIYRDKVDVEKCMGEIGFIINDN
jgi:hypothetical protein